MTLSQRIEAFALLGDFLRQFAGNEPSENKTAELKVVNQTHYSHITRLIHETHFYNAWFTPENVKHALTSIATVLQYDKLHHWTGKYPGLQHTPKVKRIGTIMAGNIPLVGFHDFLCILIAGHQFAGKLSSKDDKLLKAVAQVLIDIEPEFKPRIQFIEGHLTNPDAVIATGSDNTARYFEYYFKKYPNIIRRNRNSIAIINGNETKERLKLLADDVFLYFGLGCRSISKIYIQNIFPEQILDAFRKYQSVIHHNKYANNYNYQRAIHAMGRIPFLDNGFILMKEANPLSSPVGVLHYEKYTDINKLQSQLEKLKNQIQCIVSDIHEIKNRVSLGESQHPELNDYADGIDTIEFLCSI